MIAHRSPPYQADVIAGTSVVLGTENHIQLAAASGTDGSATSGTSNRNRWDEARLVGAGRSTDGEGRCGPGEQEDGSRND
eukprot:CAMPEP_0178712054 /NCGR_PEP_ID=MMETSP0699-20121125/18676_1 /TAXON_ID=265572 /ORGANISM="Extubocellulus spinifer, Strain CCMP396" /LENGTH=79 /DNA_ID=CAMNT_0020360777 /DNA_START=1197 /DNA_END=1437 /DNA_ORIENTATION=-